MSWAEKKQCGGIFSRMEKTSITVSFQDSYPAKKCSIFYTDFLHRLSIHQRREFKGIKIIKIKILKSVN